MTDVELKTLADPRLRSLLDPRDLKALRRRALLDRNRAFTDLMSWTTCRDYLSYVRLYHGDPNVVDLARPEIIARYCASKNLGRWSDLEDNVRRRCRGTRTYPPKYWDIPEEDLTTMMNNAILHEPRPAPEAADEARTRFAEATRQASFSLQLGIREIRLLAARPWTTTRWLQPEYTAGLQRLIEKGLLIHEIGAPPRLSEAGELARRMLVLSRHIVDPGTDADV
jgi:hypothetical protein